MAHDTAFDGLQWPEIQFPYNRILSELSDEPRFIRGRNGMVSLGGKLCKRNGTVNIENTYIADKRIDRLWVYETLDTPPRVYIVASMYDSATLVWGIYWIRLDDAVPVWTALSNIRQINASTQPHEGITSRGLFYIKGFPSAASGEKLGTVMFDGTAGANTTQFWGILPPTSPAALVGAIAKLTADVSDSATTFSVDTVSGFPATPFDIQIDFELCTVTSISVLDLTVTRGVNGTIPEAYRAGELLVWRNWTTSAHQVTVNISWAYTYAYKTTTGQVSNRAPLETNLDKLPSRTGPFLDLIPKFTLTGNSDTTNVPEIIVFRSTDGGGTYYELETITNTGGSITYSDDSYESGVSGGTFQDPIPDSELDQGTRATTLTSNSPPPAVISPEVTGEDTPVQSTPVASYAARLWYGIGNILLYSGQEEVTLGIPEECWPSGQTGNFFRFQYPITNVAATSSALYVFTLEASYEVTGTNRETFNVKPIFDNLGAPYGHPRAVTRYQDTIFVLTQDFRIAQIQDNQVNVVSDPLFTDIIDQVNRGGEFDIKFWGDLEKEWLVVAGHDVSNTAYSLQWVFDLKKTKDEKKAFWFVPWGVRSTCIASGRIEESSGQRRLIFAVYDQDTNDTCLVRLDPTNRTGGDYFVTEQVGFDFFVDTNLFLVPAGNHVNKLRVPGITPVVYAISLDRLLFAADTDPNIFYYKDDLWTDPINPPDGPEDPARRELSKQYKTLFYGIQEVAQRVAVNITKLESKELFECMNLIILWNPDAGS